MELYCIFVRINCGNSNVTINFREKVPLEAAENIFNSHVETYSRFRMASHTSIEITIFNDEGDVEESFKWERNENQIQSPE